MFFVDITQNESLTVFLAVIIPLVVIGLIYLLYLSYKKERKRYKEELQSYIEGVMSKREISASISTYITKAPEAEFSLLKIDIDRSAYILEALGKEETDKIIKTMASRIVDILPNRVDCARIDYDQFEIFLKGEYEHEVAELLAQKIIEVVSEPFKVYSDTTINLTVSVSICFYPMHGSTTKQLHNSLDIALYQAKRGGGNQYRVYSVEAGEAESANIEYYREIKEGIKNKEFALYYQPIIDSLNNKVCGVEGLLRWNHPELGVLSPYKFINIMEQSGDILWVGEWGFECLLKAYTSLKHVGRLDDDFVASLNLSVKQLSDPQMPLAFQRLSKRFKVNPSNIALEIEEYALYDKHDVVKNNIKMLKEAGFKISVDKFGVDYNGIKRLEEYGIDIVKLDREYLDKDADVQLKQNFLNMLKDFAKANNISLIIEGVEDTDELKYANELGVYNVQGYNFAKPMPSDEIEEYVQSKDWTKHMVSENETEEEAE